MSTINLSAPWIDHYRKMDAFFKFDHQVRVVYDSEAEEVTLYVDSPNKAEALYRLLPTKKELGNGSRLVTLKIVIVPPNGYEPGNSKYDFYIKDAFRDNSALSYVKTINGVFDNDMTFVVFRNAVVQYFNDGLYDINGMRSTLYEELARDIFNPIPGVYYNTDVPAIGLEINPIASRGRPLYK